MPALFQPASQVLKMLPFGLCAAQSIRQLTLSLFPTGAILPDLFLLGMLIGAQLFARLLDALLQFSETLLAGIEMRRQLLLLMVEGLLLLLQTEFLFGQRRLLGGHRRGLSP